MRFRSCHSRIGLAAVAMLAAAAISACSSGGGSGSGDGLPTYTVGFVGALSGPLGASGRVEVQGLQAGIQYANTLHVANFKMVTRDSGGDPSTGANLARQLAQSGAKAIFAGTTDVAAIQPVANQYKILVADSGGITGIVSKIGTDKEFSWAFCPDTACGASTVLPEVQFLTKVDPNGTIGELSDTSVYGTGTSALVNPLVKQEFPSVHMVQQTFPLNATSVISQLTKLRNEGATSLLVWTYGSPLVMVMQSLDQMGWYPYVVGPLGMGDPSVVAATPAKLKHKAIAGGIATAQVASAPGAAATGLNKTYFDLYTKIAKVTDYDGLSTVASYPFDWLVVLASAIKATHSTDPTTMRDWLTAGHVIQTSEGPQHFGPDQRIGTSLATTTVYDPAYPCTEGVCVAPQAAG